MCFLVHDGMDCYAYLSANSVRWTIKLNRFISGTLKPVQCSDKGSACRFQMHDPLVL